MWRTILLILSALGVTGVAVGVVGHQRGWWQVPPGQQQRPLLSAALHVCVACARQVTRDLALLVPV